MLRIRKRDGSVVEIPEGDFVEICDTAQNIALVFIAGKEVITTVAPGSPEAQQYSRMFGVQFSRLVRLPLEVMPKNGG